MSNELRPADVAPVEGGQPSGIQSTLTPDSRASAAIPTQTRQENSESTPRLPAKDKRDPAESSCSVEPAPLGTGAVSLLRERRSSRQFSATPLPDHVVNEVIAQAAWAPSGGNVQPWRVAVLGPRAVERFLERCEADSLYMIEPMLKLAFIHLAEREQRPVRQDLNEFVVSKLAPSLRMGGAPPSHILVVYFERKTLARRLREIGHGISLAWYRLWNSERRGQGLHYLWLMVVNLARLLATDDKVRAMGLSNFVYAITLAAQSRSIDSCIQCQFVVLRNQLRRVLALDDRFEVFACVSLGRPRSDPADPAATRFPTARYPVPTKWIE